MIIDTTPTKIAGSFHKCCSCGHVVDPSLPVSSCSCDKKVLAYYPECPKCKHNGMSISYCRFCTNSGYDDLEYRYANEYISKHESRGWTSSFLRKMELDGLLSEEILNKALDMLFKV